MIRLARLFQSLTTAATVVYAQLFKHAGCAQVPQRQFAYRLSVITLIVILLDVSSVLRVGMPRL